MVVARNLITFGIAFSGAFFCAIVGGYCEARWRIFTSFRDYFRKRKMPPVESFQVEGDPGLARWVEGQRPCLPRPDLSSTSGVVSWQRALRKNLLDLFDLENISSAIPVRAQHISQTIVDDNITRIFMSFESYDGTMIPAYLFLPRDSSPRPAIIVLHGHVEPNDIGIMQTAGIVESYQHGAALELARSGYVTFAMEFRGFGYLGARANAEHRLVAYNALLGGGFYKGILAKDIQYAMAYVQSLDAVLSDRIGMTGLSYGGEMAVTYAALDERVKVVVCQGFGGDLGAQPGLVGAAQTEQTPHFYHLIPGHNKYFFQEDLFYLLAPRPLLSVRGNGDLNDGPDFFDRIGGVYHELAASMCFRFEILPGSHEYFIEPAIRFFSEHL